MLAERGSSSCRAISRCVQRSECVLPLSLVMAKAGLPGGTKEEYDLPAGVGVSTSTVTIGNGLIADQNIDLDDQHTMAAAIGSEGVSVSV